MNKLKSISFLLLPAICCFQFLVADAQYISINGAYVSISSGTVVGVDTINNNISTTLANDGTITLNTIINAGTIQGNGIYNIAKAFTNSGTFSAGTSTVHFNGIVAQTIPALTFYNLTASGSGTTKTAGGSLAVNGTLTSNANVVLDMSTYDLGGTLGTITNNGTIKTQSTSASPLSSNKTWTGLINYNSSAAQTIVYGNYTDLTASGGNRTIAASGTVGIAGTFIPGAGTYTVTSSTVNFNGSSAQTVPAFNFNNLTLSGGNTKNCGGNINIANTVLLAASTTLALGSYNIKLQSDSTYTARVATVPSSATITYGTGRFIAERYVIGRRKYRLITSPVTTSPNASLIAGEEALSIWGNWQNQANNSTSNAGTFITGGSPADGYDQQTPNASLFTYNSTTRSFTGFTTANGKNTKYTPLKAGVPYYMFVFGDRTNSAYTSNPNRTVLTATGKILTGDQAYTTSSSIPLSNVAGGYTMIGNPFASPVDWSTISKTNVSDTYWGWDPNLSSTGGYVTVSTTGTVTLISPFSGSVGLDQYIQSGQSFFVKTTAASPVLTIKESDKVSNYNTIAFRKQSNDIPLIAVNLLNTDPGGTKLMDGALAAFDDSFFNEVGNEDATKIIKTGENLSLECQNELLSINARKIPGNNDTLLLNMTGFTKPQYTLQIFANQLDNTTLETYLEDAWLHTRKLLSLTDTNYIPFSIAPTDLLSADKNRFRIVFKQTGALADIITSVSAVKENRQVKINWDISSEQGVQKYQVEKESMGNGFTTIGEITAMTSSAAASYKWIDDNPSVGANNYRIKVINNDGSVLYSRLVTVIVNEEKPEMTVYPNPVESNQVNIRFINLEKGKYAVRLFAKNGQLVMQTELNYDGGSASQSLSISSAYAAGPYILQVTNSKIKLNQVLIKK